MSESVRSNENPEERTDYLTEAQYHNALKRGMRVSKYSRRGKKVEVGGTLIEGGISRKMSDFLRSISGVALTSQHTEIWKAFATDAVELGDDAFLAKWYEIIQGDQMPINPPIDYCHDIPKVWIDPEE